MSRPGRISRAVAATLVVAAAGCAQGSLPDAGPPVPTGERPPTTIVDAGWLDEVVLPDPLEALPPHQAADVDDLATHDTCQLCHASVPGNPAMRDEAERPVGADELWRASMMGLSGRDPYWLAVFSHERAEHPGGAALIEDLCTRCHAPAANERGRAIGAPLTLEAVTADETPAGHLARDGATCTVCHRIADVGLGTPASFTGGFVLDTEGAIFGPHEDPQAETMTTATGYTATHGPHVMASAACATCHTVITHALDEAGEVVGPDFPEQVPYLEWRNSVFVDEGPSPGPEARSCADCHVPTVSEDGAPLMTRIASAPALLAERSPYGRHTFVGGNAYMQFLIGNELPWVNAPVTPTELMAASAATEANLRTAARLTLVEPDLGGGELRVAVRIENLTGHRFPTAYPSRRAFVRVTVEDATGAVLWRSGRTHVLGGLTARGGDRLDYPGAWSPHFDEITREDQVQVYEGVMGGLDGEMTRSLLLAAGYLKDNRILPRGWSADHPDAPLASPVGVDADPDFLPGEDTVRYRIQRPEGAALLRVELVFQTVPAPAIEHLFDAPTPETARFDAMRRARPDRGRVVAMEEIPIE